MLSPFGVELEMSVFKFPDPFERRGWTRQELCVFGDDYGKGYRIKHIYGKYGRNFSRQYKRTSSTNTTKNLILKHPDRPH